MKCPTCNGNYHRGKNGTGSSYADKFKKPTPSHSRIIRTMLEIAQVDKQYTKNTIYEMLVVYYKTQGLPRPKFLPFHARMSELMRKGVFVMSKGDVTIKVSEDLPPITMKKPIYSFNKEYAIKVLNTNSY